MSVQLDGTSMVEQSELDIKEGKVSPNYLGFEEITNHEDIDVKLEPSDYGNEFSEFDIKTEPNFKLENEELIIKQEGSIQTDIKLDAACVSMSSCQDSGLCSNKSKLLQYRENYEIEQKGHPSNHSLLHRSPRELPQTKQKHSRELDQSDKFNFQTKYKDHLETQKLLYEKLPKYACIECEYRTKDKSRFTKHLIRHKALGEREVFSCNECDFQTKYRSCLQRHTLLHVCQPSLTCRECDYRTMFKGNLKNHMLRHKASSECKIFCCAECGHQTRYRRSFLRHLLLHKEPSKCEFFTCGECEFQTIYKSSLKQHKHSHETTTTLEINTCLECGYKTKFKRNFSNHMLQHKDPTRNKVYTCPECEFQTKYRQSQARHLLQHIDPSFQPKHRGVLSKQT